MISYNTNKNLHLRNKKLIPGICLLTLLLFACTSSYIHAGTQKKYPKSKCGIIKYEITGKKTGTEILYYEDWGLREVRYSDTVMDLMGTIVTRSNMTLMENNGEWITTIDLGLRTGLRIKNPRFKEYIDKSRPELEKITEMNLIDMGAAKSEIERIAGKNCEVWRKKHTGEQVWTWNGIVLKKETGNGFARTTVIATEILEGVSIPKEKFAIPPDIQVKTVDMRTLHGN